MVAAQGREAGCDATGPSELPLIVQIVVWVLPVMIGLWVWETSRPLLVRLVFLVGVAGSNLFMFLPRALQAKRSRDFALLVLFVAALDADEACGYGTMPGRGDRGGTRRQDQLAFRTCLERRAADPTHDFGRHLGESGAAQA